MPPAIVGPGPWMDPPVARTPLTVLNSRLVSNSQRIDPSLVECARSAPSFEPENSTPGMSDGAEMSAALHPVPAAWQRDLPSLLVRENLRGLVFRPDGEVRGYVLYSGDEQVRLHDIAATDAGVARRLLRALQRRSRVIVSINEPSDSTLTAAFAATGFSEADRQYDLAVQL